MGIGPVEVVGIGADGLSGLSARVRAIVEGATFLAGGRRHLAMVDGGPAERFAIGDNVDGLVDRLQRREAGERCVVLASGDPLFFGIGHRLALELGRDQVRVEPSVSSPQLAFARAGLSWHDATIASVHGRDLASTLRPLLGRPKVGLFTRDGSSPSEIAGFFLGHGLGDYNVTIAERLGAVDERVIRLPISEVPGRTFDPLNFVILESVAAGKPPAFPIPTPDSAFAGPESGPILLTHEEIRAITLTRFRGLPDGPVWDVGAGLGGVSVDLARTFPEREVVAFERSDSQFSYLVKNRIRFSAFNIRAVHGEAPGCMASEARPAAVFLGGSGGRLDAILDLVFDRLIVGGVLVANFVGLENLARFSERVRSAGWPMGLSQVQVSHGRPLGGLTALEPLRPIWIVRAMVPPGNPAENR
jgi:precorrin-6Y C5,15-methyltransferase (decarboxylating)